MPFDCGMKEEPLFIILKDRGSSLCVKLSFGECSLLYQIFDISMKVSYGAAEKDRTYACSTVIAT